MIRTFVVTSDYTVIDRAPLALHLGQEVRVGRHDSDWPGWVWVTNAEGRGSYVPEEVIGVVREGVAVVKTAFQAHDLSVTRSDVVESLREVKGWHWCRKVGSHDEGWLPSYLLVAAPANQ